MNEKLISIITPMFNEEENVSYYYKSMREMADSLASEYNFEFIITDNSSTDATFKILQNITQDDLDKSKDVAYNFTADVIKRYSAGLKDKLLFVDSFRVYSQKMIILKNIGIE